ncbi:MAG: SoxR reducing system RseC family protein [bacterium]|nr:SoxR reducing system RseC family protein [bacterium]
MQGPRLVAASFLYFLVPAVTALVGAAAGSDPLEQLIGGAIGLLLGMLVAITAARRYRTALEREACFEPR